MKEKIFAEIGLGNKSILSTEFENKNKEHRINKFIMPKKVMGIYIRIWILKRVLIISTYDGIKFNKKDENKFKFLFGIEGVN